MSQKAPSVPVEPPADPDDAGVVGVPAGDRHEVASEAVLGAEGEELGVPLDAQDGARVGQRDAVAVHLHLWGLRRKNKPDNKETIMKKQKQSDREYSIKLKKE